jgi:uncharacterized protein
VSFVDSARGRNRLQDSIRPRKRITRMPPVRRVRRWTGDLWVAKGAGMDLQRNREGKRKHRWMVLVAIVGGLSMMMLVGGCSDESEGADATTTAAASTVTAPNTITVLGKATVSSVPDEAVLSLTVESDGTEPGAAMNANSTAVTKVMDRLKAEGVEATAIETANVTVYPGRAYNQQTGEETLTGYRAQNTVTVTLKDAGTVSKVLSAAVEAGVNTFSGPVWRLRDDSAAVADALKQAVANARAKAETLAGAQGVKVGDVLMMNEGSVEVPASPVYYEAYDMGRSAASAAVAAPPISAASLDVTATVTVTYVLAR